MLLKKHPEFAACISNEAKLAVFVSNEEEASTRLGPRSGRTPGSRLLVGGWRREEGYVGHSLLCSSAGLPVPGARQAKKEALQALFASFMSCDPATSKANLKTLLLRLQAEQSKDHPHPHDEPPWERKCARAILRLAQQFPGDAGAMAPLFLNYLLIAPGEEPAPTRPPCLKPFWSVNRERDSAAGLSTPTSVVLRV